MSTAFTQHCPTPPCLRAPRPLKSSRRHVVARIGEERSPRHMQTLFFFFFFFCARHPAAGLPLAAALRRQRDAGRGALREVVVDVLAPGQPVRRPLLGVDLAPCDRPLQGDLGAPPPARCGARRCCRVHRRRHGGRPGRGAGEEEPGRDAARRPDPAVGGAQGDHRPRLSREVGRRMRARSSACPPAR